MVTTSPSQRKRIWDLDQTQVFDEVKNGVNNIVVNALPGSGKTTVILEALKLIPKSESIIFLSFGRSIVEELKERVPAYVQATTLHSKGLSIIRSKYPRVTIQKDKYFKAFMSGMKEMKKEDFRDAYRCVDLCNLARMTMTDWNNRDALIELANHYDIEFNETVLEKTQSLLTKLTKNFKLVDFTDMIFMPASNPEWCQNIKYNFICLDECQDTNEAQRVLINNLMSKKSRLIAVGDPKQSIYSFSGSTVDAFERLRDSFGCVELKLTRSYRVSQAVARDAQTVYDDIRAFEENPEGVAREGSPDEIEEGDIVLSRTTKPLVYLFFNLIDQHKKAFIEGKDIQAGLVSLAESCKSFSKDGVMINLRNKEQQLIAELKAAGITKPKKHPSLIALQEKIEVLKVLLTRIPFAGDLTKSVKDLFDDSRGGIRLMTIHRAKGLENERVFIVTHHEGKKLMPHENAISDWQQIQERNLMFVAKTRAKMETIYISL